MKNLNLHRTGSIHIMSSGYADRYVVSTPHLTIERNGIEYQIHKDAHRVGAVLDLAGLDHTDENVNTAIHAIVNCPLTEWITYQTGNGTRTFQTTSNRIESGIAVALDKSPYNEHGMQSRREIAKKLTADEWAAIAYWLGRINDEHGETGRGIATFHVPGGNHEA